MEKNNYALIFQIDCNGSQVHDAKIYWLKGRLQEQNKLISVFDSDKQALQALVMLPVMFPQLWVGILDIVQHRRILTVWRIFASVNHHSVKGVTRQVKVLLSAGKHEGLEGYWKGNFEHMLSLRVMETRQECLAAHVDAYTGQDDGECPLFEPLPSYGPGKDAPGGRVSSLIGGSHLTHVIITCIFSMTAIKCYIRNPNNPLYIL